MNRGEKFDKSIAVYVSKTSEQADNQNKQAIGGKDINAEGMGVAGR